MVDPARRFPDMDALLATLDHGRRNRRVVLAVALATFALITALLWAGSPAREAARPQGTIGAALPPRAPRALRRLTSYLNEMGPQYPAISPDGKRLVFHKGDNSGDVNGNAFVRDLGSGDTRALNVLVAGFDWAHAKHFSWLSDSQRLLVSLDHGLYLASLADGTFTRLLVDADCHAAASPGDTHVAFVAATKLELFELAHPATRRLLHSGLAGAQPAWSPDGRFLAAVTADGDHIRVVDLAGQVRAEIAAPTLLNMASRTGIVWRRDGRLLYPQQDGERTRILAQPMDVSGRPAGAPELLATFEGGVSDLSTTSDGARLVLLGVDSRRQVFMSSLSANGTSLVGPPRLLSSTDASEGVLDFSLDGQLLLVSSKAVGSPRTSVRLQPSDGGRGEGATTISDDSPWRTLAPEGSALYGLSTAPGGLSRVLEWPLDGGTVRTRALLPALPRDAHYSGFRCRRTVGCVLGIWQQQRLTFRRFDWPSGLGATIGVIDWKDATLVRDWELSPSGRWIAAARDDSRVTLIDTRDGSERLLHEAAGGFFEYVDWDPDEKSIVVAGIVTPAPQPYQILRIGLDGRATVLWATADTWLTRLRISPDRRQLAFTAVSWDTEVWTLDDP
jgi:Tol biopolymer transport system component